MATPRKIAARKRTPKPQPKRKAWKLQGLVDPKHPRYLPMNEAAAYLNIPPRLLRNLARDGKIAVHRFGARYLYFAVADLEAYAALTRQAMDMTTLPKTAAK